MIDHSEELIPEMTAREVGDLLTQGADFVLLDVREPYELNWARLEDDRVLHVPLSYVAQRGLAALPDGLRQHPGPLVVLCHLGFRSAQVTAWMHKITRRDFLKLSFLNLALGLASLAFRPLDNWQSIDLTTPKRLPSFPDAAAPGRVTQPGIALRSHPTNSDGDNNLIARLPADTLLVWEKEVVGAVIGGLTYQRFVETPDGFVYGGMVQPVGNQINTPFRTSLRKGWLLGGSDRAIRRPGA
jgi:rhodanese-related sulfurtransferase